MTRVVYTNPGYGPWNVITTMVRLTARLLEATLVEREPRSTHARVRRVAGRVPRRRRGGEPLLVVAPEPVDLNAVLHLRSWTRGYAPVAGLVVDSWWVDRIPACARRGFFDLLYVTEKESVEPWRAATGADVRWLPIGTNALDWGTTATAPRPVTLQRIGRQPAAWDDDAAVGAALRGRGLTFRGRPDFVSNPDRAVATLIGLMSEARFVLAFGNRHDETTYTHPTREYVTSRWTDALAAGAVVAGIPPDCATAREVLWPGALADLGTTDLRAGTDALVELDAAWTPQTARTNGLLALERLDWRWRIAEIADGLGVSTTALTAELERLERAIVGAREGL